MSSRTKTKTRRRSPRSSRRRETARRSRPKQRANPLKNEDGSWDRGAIMKKGHAVAAEMQRPDRYHDRLSYALKEVWDWAKRWPDVNGGIPLAGLAEFRYEGELLAGVVERNKHKDERKRQRTQEAKKKAEEDGIEYAHAEVVRDDWASEMNHETTEYIPQHDFLQVGSEHIELCSYKPREHRRSEPGGADLVWYIMAPRGKSSGKPHHVSISTRHLTVKVQTRSYTHAQSVYETMQDMDIWELGELFARCKMQQSSIKEMLQRRLNTLRKGELSLSGQVIV